MLQTNVLEIRGSSQDDVSDRGGIDPRESFRCLTSVITVGSKNFRENLTEKPPVVAIDEAGGRLIELFDEIA
jgi:hypothetical protein